MKCQKNKFSIIEMVIVLVIIAILISMSVLWINIARRMSQITITRNTLNQYKGMISKYYTDYSLLPTPGQINPHTFSDATASTQYWKRIPGGNYQVNQINKLLVTPTKNAELYFDYYNYDEGSLNTIAEFNAKYPGASKDRLIPLASWYIGAATPLNLEMEELSVIAHSSKFLNYYMSGSGFGLVNDGSYVKPESKWLANFDTSFRFNTERSAMVKPYLFFAVNSSNFFDSLDKSITNIPSVTSWLQSKSLIYFDYLQKTKKNLDEDNYRRLYFYNDKTPEVPSGKYDPKKVTLNSDRIMFNSNFFGSTSLKEASALKDSATIAQANATALLAAAITPAQIATANLAIKNAQALVDAADLALKNAKPGDYNNSNSDVYMRAHADNVKNIVDAFNSPIVYITHVNQRKESARTYNYLDPISGKADPSKDKSMRSDSFILYSLGPNKADDSNLGEYFLNGQKKGDDIIENSGAK